MNEFKFALDLANKIGKAFINASGEREKQIAQVSDELLVTTDDLIPYFIEPYLQPFNPVDDDGLEDREFRTPAFRFIEKFLTGPKKNDGSRCLFILGDAGMGKSSLLAMLKLAHAKSLFPKGYKCVALKLGKRTLSKIETLNNKGNTLLLLDALDEDSTSFGRMKQRIVELLKGSQSFFRIIITCRTQFFPKTDDPVFQRQDRVRIQGFTCPIKYLSLFDESQIRDYLARKVPLNQVEKAFQIVDHMDDLRCRPMLLAYIDDLLESENFSNPYAIYNGLVQTWLDREARKQLDGVNIDSHYLLKACRRLARHMTITSSREVSEDFVNLFEVTKELSSIRSVNVGGRSLLNRNSDGYYRFAHISFQEFLTVQTLELGEKWEFPNCTDMMANFMRNAKLKNSDFTESNLTSVDLSTANMNSSNFTKSVLYGAKLCFTNLNNSVLVGADLRRADLEGAHLENCNMEGAILNDANLNQVDLTNANLLQANLKGIKNWGNIKSILEAKINGVKNAPVGFRKWALKNGAIEPKVEGDISKNVDTIYEMQNRPPESGKTL